MAKFFEVNFRSGSFADTTGRRTVTVTGSPEIKKGEKGMAVKTGISDYLAYSSQVIPDNAFTVVAYIKRSIKNPYIGEVLITDSSSTGMGISIEGAVHQGMLLTLNSPNDDTNVRQWSSITDVKWHFLIITLDGNSTGAIAYRYLDGITEAPGSRQTGAQASRSDIKNVGYCYNRTISIAYLATYDHIFTEDERAAALRDFNNSYPIEKEKYPNYISKPIDLSNERFTVVNETEIATNNGFDLDIDWGKGAGWSITGGTAVHTGASGGSLNSAAILTIGKRYRIVYDIVEVVGGEIIIGGSTGYGDAFHSTTGRTQFDFTALGTVVYLYSNNGISIDNVSVKELTGLVAAYNMIPQGNTLVDISGNGRAVVWGVKDIISTGKGVKTRTGVSNVYPSSSINLTESWSISTRFKVDDPTICPLVWDGSIGHGGILMYYTNWSYYYAGGTNNQTFGDGLSDSLHNWATYSFISNGTTVSMYADGIFIGSVTPTSTNIIISHFFNFFGGSGESECEDLRFHNRALTESEIKAYHNSFVKPYLVEDFSTEGADGVAKVPTGWVKQSGSFKIGEIQLNPTVISDISSFSVAYGTSISNSDGSYTYTVTNEFHDIQGYYKNIFITGKKYKMSFFAKSSNYTGNRFYYKGITSQTNVCAVYDPLLSSEYQYYEYLIQASDATMYIGFLDVVVGKNFIWKDLRIQEATGLSSIRNGSKYLECVTAGVIAIPSKQAYGTWEWDWRNGDYWNSYVGFINLKNSVAYDTGPALYLNGANNGVVIVDTYVDNGFAGRSYMSTVAATPKNIWYRVKVTRSISGITTVLVKGGSLIPTEGYNGWTLVSTVISGSNPFADTNFPTTSEYFKLYMQAGDRITNIVLTDGIRS